MSDVFMNTYHRLPVTFAKGEGVWLFDVNGNKYLDFASGIAVNCLGHNYPPLVRAITEQAAKLNHTCNYYKSDVSSAFAEKLAAACSGAGMKKVFLANSGAEANEGACKIARKYSLKKYGHGRHQIVTLRGSFHGRTITTLSATGQDVFHKDFGPFTEGFLYAPGNDIEALDRVLDPNTTAGKVFLCQPKDKGGKRPVCEPEEIAFTHAPTPHRGSAVADMAHAILEKRAPRASGEMAQHVVDAMQAFEESGNAGRHIELGTTCAQPAPLPSL